jgi:hypothetical protein
VLVQAGAFTTKRRNTMRNGNGRGGQDVGAMLAEMLGQRQAPKSDEEIKAAAQEAFDTRLDAALNGTCPGNQDQRHAEMEQRMLGLLQTAFGGGRALLPEPITDAVLKIVAFEALHHEEGFAEGLKVYGAPEMQAVAMMVAGAVLRVKDLPETAGIKLSTGHYV